MLQPFRPPLETEQKQATESLRLPASSREFPRRSKMQLMVWFVAMLLFLCTVKASVLPQEEKFSAHSSQEQTKARKGLILRMLVDLLDGADVGRDAAALSESEDFLGNKLEDDPTVLGRLSQISQRDRKTPCKNFFWKTFTAC